MAELKGNKRTPSIDLSFFTPNDHIQTNNENSLGKSSNKFEGPNGVVGLGIVVAMDQLDQALDPYFTPGAPILAVSARSSPIPICSPVSTKSGTKLGSNLGEMELSEEHKCVIYHIGNNLIKKREYFDGDLCKKYESSVTPTSYWVSSGVFSAAWPLAVTHRNESTAKAGFGTADFLSFCYLCKKKLHGLDIFMYRGEKAFCSAEWRYKQMRANKKSAVPE